MNSANKITALTGANLALLIGVILGSSGYAATFCATPGKDGTTQSKNTYYPGILQTVTTLSLGARRVDTDAGTTEFSAGDLALVIQMQDATITTPATVTAKAGKLTYTDSINYGDGSTGRGYTALGSSGKYELKRVASVTLTGGVATSITLAQPLVNPYTRVVAAGNARKTFQVIRVPQYKNLALSSATVPTWNGDTGGVFAIDVEGSLNLNSATVNVSSKGFRGGGSLEDFGVYNSAIVAYASTYDSTKDYTDTDRTPNELKTSNYGASKGEGVAGTPRFVRDDTQAAPHTTTDLTSSGYPSSLDRSRGAPANAGGGGTAHNAGGGGGSNGGVGGHGGRSYGNYSAAAGAANFYATGGDGFRPVYGLGGVSLTGASPTSDRLFIGGGGGAGDGNDANDTPGTAQSGGGAGGGIIFIRTVAVTGTGTFKANGQDAQNAGRDGTGGGGAGGTIAFYTPVGVSLSGVTANVNGGAGGSTGLPLKGGERQGTGGGGGGGVLLSPSSFNAASTLTGGAAGINAPTTTFSDTFDAAAGNGFTGTTPTFDPEGTDLGILCPDVSVVKTSTKNYPTLASPNFTYTLTVTNLGQNTAKAVQLTDTLPSGVTFVSSVASQGSYSSASGTWNIGNLTAGQVVTLNISVTLNATGAALTQVDNTGVVSITDATQLDPTLSNNTSLKSVFPEPIRLNKTVQKVLPTPAGTVGTSVTAKPGDTLEYCITASSILAVARDVGVSDTLVANQSFVMGSITGASPSSFVSPTVTGTLTGVSSSTSKTMCFRTTVN